MLASTRLRPQHGQKARSAGAKAAQPLGKTSPTAAAKSSSKKPVTSSAKSSAKSSIKQTAKSSAKTPAASKRSGKAAKVLAVVSGWGVYILRCADATLYTGCTNDRDRRLAAHGKGRVKYTRGRLPVAIVYWESSADKSAALRREAALKRLSRRAKLALCG